MGKFSILARSILACFLILFGIVTAGCRTKLHLGHYEGTFTSRVNEAVSQESAQIELLGKNHRDFAFHVRTQSGRIEKAVVRAVSSDQIRVKADFIPGGATVAYRLESEPSVFKTECYGNSGKFDFEFCYNRQQFFLQVILKGESSRYITLSGFYFKDRKDFELEVPVSLTLTQAIETALRQNFESRLAYERVSQARYAALSAYLNLVPHLSSNLIWNVAPNYITFLATIQNVMPFLLPSYWLQARQASADREMKEVAFQMMRADLVATVEELTYSLERDLSLFHSHFRFLQQVQSFQREVEEAALRPTVRDDLLSLAHFLQKALKSDVSDISKLIRQDRHSLASTLGYHNLEAVRGVHIDREDVPIDLAEPLVPQEFAHEAVRKAFDVKRVEGAARISGLKRLENFFLWKDPTADPKQGFGANTVTQQLEKDSQGRDFAIQEEQVETQVFHSSYKLALDFNEAYHTYYEVTKELNDAHFDLNQVLQDAKDGRLQKLDVLKENAQAYVASFVAQHTTLANYRIARAKKDRFLLSGFFAEVGPRLRNSMRLKKDRSFLGKVSLSQLFKAS